MNTILVIIMFLITSSIMGALYYLQMTQLSKYVPMTTLDNYARASALSEYAKSTALGNYVKATDLSTYAKIDDLSGYAKASDLTNYAKAGDLSGYALKANINTSCQEMTTPLQDGANQTLMYLDRQNVTCPMGTTLSGFRVVRGTENGAQTNQIQYKYTCCGSK